MDFKRIGTVLTVVILATLTWGATHEWLAGPHPFSDVMAMIRPAIALCVLAAVTGLAFAILSSRWDRWAIILASWATFIFFWPPDIWYVSALPLFVLFWHEAARRISDDLVDRRKVRISATLGRGVKLILLGAFLMVSVGFYLLPANREADLGVVSRGVQGALESAYDAPIVEQQLAELPPALQAQFRRDVAEYVDTAVQDWLGPYQGVVPPFLAFALFLALWSVSFVLKELAIWLGHGLLIILRLTKFVGIEERDVKAEKLVL
jgi:hypothetical protein